MSTKKININDVMNQEFYQLPKILIWDKKYREGLSDSAKLLYMIIRDRFTLSLHTAKKQSESGESAAYQDEKGDIFCVLDNVEIAFTLNKSVKSVITYIEELAALNLISITKVKGGANRIYLNHLESNDINLAHFLGERDFFKHVHSCKKKGKELTKTLEECIKTQVQKRNNNNSHSSSEAEIPSSEDVTPPGDVNTTPPGGNIITPPGVEKLHPNENELNKPELNKPYVKENINKSSKKESDKPLEEEQTNVITSQDDYALLDNFSDLKEICPDKRALNVVKNILLEAGITTFYKADVLNAISQHATNVRVYQRRGELVKYPPAFFANNLVDRIRLNEVRRKTKTMSKVNTPMPAKQQETPLFNLFSEVMKA